MFFCDTCGSLKHRRTVRGEVAEVCPKCDGVAPAAGKAWWQTDGRSTPTGAAAGGGRGGTFGTLTAPRGRRDAPAGAAPGPAKPAQERRRERHLPPPPKVTLEPDADLFPYSDVRAGQREFISDVQATVAAGGVLVANAPTGLGKTVSSLAPIVAHALANDKRVFFLTSKQSQHKIAVDTMQAVRERAGVPIVVSDVIAKQAMCPRSEAKDLYARRFAEFCRRQVVNRECDYFETANTEAVKALKARIHHVEAAVRLSTSCGTCPHQAALDLAAQAHVTVCDYNYFFSDMREGIQERLRVALKDAVIIVDEAHNLPDRIRDHLTLELNDYVLDDAADELSDLGDERIRRLVDGLREVVPALADDPDVASEGRDGEGVVARDVFIARVDQHFERGVESLTASDFESLVSDLTVAVDAYEDKFKEAPRGIALVRDFLVNWKRERPGLARLFRREPVPTLQYRMLDPALLARHVFDEVHAAVLMSGTLYPGEMYRDVLGLPKDRTRVATYASPFPRENRLLIVDAGVTTSYQERGDAMSARIATDLAAAAENTPGNFAAFFPSYAVLESVRPHLEPLLQRKHLVVEERGGSKAEKESLVDTVRGHDGQALLVGVQGGSLSEGYDYEDNLLKGVAIVGLPFAAPSLEVQALIDYYNKKFGAARGRQYAYVYPTLNRVLQAAGRCIRSADDRAVVLLMDKRFDWGSYRQMYPPGFDPRVSTDPARDVAAFWRR